MYILSYSSRVLYSFHLVFLEVANRTIQFLSEAVLKPGWLGWSWSQSNTYLHLLHR